MTQQPYSIRLMHREELQIAIAWATAEGWNPGLHDAECFYAADSTGFWMGLRGNEPIATISAVKYGDSFGFIGFYIVKPEHRGQGYGMQLWNAALNTLSSRNIGLDGVLAQQQNYQKSGFHFAYRNIRYEGVSNSEATNHPGVVELSTIPLEIIAAYDRLFFPSDRVQFLKSWINQPDSVALGILQNDILAGYGVLRLCHRGYKIGPLFADQPTLAEALFVALQSRVGAGTPIYLDVPEINRAAVNLAEKYQMKRVFETARMYTQACPELPYDRLFGVTTFELG
ncbi:MAG: GNAT family N-acetyltransferase [Oscillatoriales cyanobacterium C42_A2020_001]|nr:GNAT family N-acetyltransferase [Leptolyngbyaceae cyanobacterium C42_A2020_001]